MAVKQAGFEGAKQRVEQRAKDAGAKVVGSRFHY